MSKLDTNRGIIKTIFIIIIGVVILSYFGFNIREIVENPTTQNNLSYVLNAAVNIWKNYLEVSIMYIWQNIFIDLILPMFNQK